ncbi:MAG: VOC family protein [Candidatus Nanopelagicaceae bacterium]|nr:VOC family protein [Candidatus Nanopelagicaceae bacterium]
MGAVTLWVADLDKMIRYYRDAIGLELFSEINGRAFLGQGTTTIVILESKPGMKYASPGEAGLFHTAILFSSQAALAKAVASVAKQHPGTFTGSADHLVSKAFYFNDPEGNGVELYWDRDRSEWSWAHGSIEMDTIFLDPNDFLREHLTEAPVEEAKKVGHVHLSVGSVEAAEEFYVKMLGFEKTLNWGNAALFVSAGGYHHHMAMNTWRSKGAGKRQLALGLGNVEIVLPSQDQVMETQDRLNFHKIESNVDAGIAKVLDPWGNQISIKSA